MREYRGQRGGSSAWRLLLSHNSDPLALFHCVRQLPHGSFGCDSAFAGSGWGLWLWLCRRRQEFQHAGARVLPRAESFRPTCCVPSFLRGGAYSISSEARLGRGTNTPQSIVSTVPGRASSSAAEILSTWGLTTGQLIADIISTAKGRSSSRCWSCIFLSPVRKTSKRSCSISINSSPFLMPPHCILTTV